MSAITGIYDAVAPQKDTPQPIALPLGAARDGDIALIAAQ